MKVLKSLFFVLCLCLNSLLVFSQTTAPAPPYPAPPTPMPSPVPAPSPLPHSSNPIRPGDTTSIEISPSPNQPPPATITPTEPFPKSQKDSVFRNIDDTPDPFRTDSVHGPKK